MARAPQLPEIIRRAIDGRLLDVRTSIAGVIVSYDALTRRATVMPGVRRQAVDGDSPPEVDTPKALEDVPVLFPGGADFEIIWPLEPGDPVRLEYSEEDDEPFYSTTSSAPVNPEVLRRHGGNVVCRPEGTRGIPNPLGKATSVSSDGSKVLIGDALGTHSVPSTELLLAAIISAVSSSATGAQDGGAAFKTALLAALNAIAPASVSLTKVKGT